MYEYWLNAYMNNAVTVQTLEKLVAAGKLSQTEMDCIVRDRLKAFGY